MVPEAVGSHPEPNAFARHWALDPNTLHLNHGSFGASPKPVLDVQSRVRERLEADAMSFFIRELEGELDRARGLLADFLGTSPARLAFVPNATAGVNTVLRSMELRPGDELLVTDHEYNACCNAVDFVAKYFYSYGCLRISRYKLDCITPYPKIPPGKVNIIAIIMDSNQFMNYLIPIGYGPFLHKYKLSFILFRRTQSVNTGNGSNYYYIFPREK